MKLPPIRTLRDLVYVVQELIDSTGKHVYAEDLQDALDRVDDTAPAWQPIATVPMDATFILAAWPCTRKGRRLNR